MRERGWKVFYYPFFEIVHYVCRDDVGFSPAVFVERYKSAYYYFQKHRLGIIGLRLFLRRPFLEYQIEQLKKYRIKDIVLCVAYFIDIGTPQKYTQIQQNFKGVR